ncbi:SDR family NAD(P)-dependent oxidoreductase [Amphritea sp. 1_MG-2023]|uniref:SDR family NAD(P)-dependent oxidoreductase n=1 Tax=Amphritea sp. 1_MG-2023 TaxID=3062670 RepID=UPI0026E2041D|nr:SDR family NAD(P)-dependent oxidoreductase [Amphritea sp. 1_MG-2023]MDO6565248.1 SDR family NAD(P)-dependent oxidoreductase [Amphritea sp. 1_MG-2023]
MSKTIFITGSTDGIGLATARKLIGEGHKVILHGRNPAKLANVQQELISASSAAQVDGFVADLSRLTDVVALANAVSEKYNQIDVLVNNAGIFKTTEAMTDGGIDLRFVVNTFAPYLLTQRLLPLLGNTGRVVNLSSAAQAPVDLKALAGDVRVADDFSAYAQSKLALTMWSQSMAQLLGDQGPVIIAVNPGSLLASKMVKEGFGVAGNDLSIGADILIRAALSDEFSTASGQYFDNDAGQFSNPHPDVQDQAKVIGVVAGIESVIKKLSV